MGTLTNLLLRTLLDVSVTVSNTVIKLCIPHAAYAAEHRRRRLEGWPAGESPCLPFALTRLLDLTANGQGDAQATDSDVH